MELRIENVNKQYGKNVWELRDFSLQLKPGVLGLLGPNGAGKFEKLNPAHSTPISWLHFAR